MNEKLIDYLVGGQRFTEFGSYKFDKLIFGSFILLVLFLFLIMFLAFGSDRDYHIHYVCNADGRDGLRCEQPFYLNFPLCEQAWSTACSDKYVPSGFEFGDPAPWIISNWGLIVGGLLFCAFVINHVVHNKSFKFGGDAE